LDNRILSPNAQWTQLAIWTGRRFSMATITISSLDINAVSSGVRDTSDRAGRIDFHMILRKLLRELPVGPVSASDKITTNMVVISQQLDPVNNF
jgi:hypothetical protein